MDNNTAQGWQKDTKPPRKSTPWTSPIKINKNWSRKCIFFVISGERRFSPMGTKTSFPSSHCNWFNTQEVCSFHSLGTTLVPTLFPHTSQMKCVSSFPRHSMLWAPSPASSRALWNITSPCALLYLLHGNQALQERKANRHLMQNNSKAQYHVWFSFQKCLKVSVYVDRFPDNPLQQWNQQAKSSPHLTSYTNFPLLCQHSFFSICSL